MNFSENNKTIKKLLDTDKKLKGIVDIRLDLVVKQALSECVKESAKETFQNVPLEEINRGSLAVSLKNLRSAGYNNAYDIYHASKYDLSKVNGISSYSASQIKDLVVDMANRILEEASVRIDPDNRTSARTKLVRAVYILKNSREIFSKGQNLYETNHKDIISYSEDAKPATSWLLWTFSSKDRKQKAEEAIDYLSNLLNQGYEEKALSYLEAKEKLYKVKDEECWNDFVLNSATYYALLEEFTKDKVKKVTDDALPVDLVEAIEKTNLNLSKLKCTLRSYQNFGVKYILSQKAVLLGDEMGLGKTVEAIGAMAVLAAQGQSHFMVVCPASVLINWTREIAKHSDLIPIKIHGNDQEALNEWITDGGVAVTTYESISKWALPEGFTFSQLVVDEAHYVKNPQAKRTQSLLKIRKHTDRVLFMTGTPLENRVDEMCFLVRCLNTSVASEIENYKFLNRSKEFREKLAPVYLRRTREAVLKELPEKTEIKEWCQMNMDELKAYSTVTYERNFMQMRQVSWQVGDIEKSTKAKRLLELCEEAKEQQRKILVFSFFLKTIEKIQMLLGDVCYGPITGAMSAEKRQEVVDEFSKAPDGSVLVAQVQAGGVGLNIQAASVVIFCEPQIKPSIENQALSRTYRMGQVRNVLVYRLLADNTVDEAIMDILSVKSELFESFAQESVAGTQSLTLSEETCNKLIDNEIAKLKGEEPKEIIPVFGNENTETQNQGSYV
ncbi:MAG: DEAD/DEAH box helicase [Abditibacteriota bacterium]|nr:DEAD/DEAH box helicase [Abditibacteriota bacterium]